MIILPFFWTGENVRGAVYAWKPAPMKPLCWIPKTGWLANVIFAMGSRNVLRFAPKEPFPSKKILLKPIPKNKKGGYEHVERKREMRGRHWI
jgi:hypothetical protein